MTEKPGKKPKIQSLGRLGSPRHQEWKAAIRASATDRSIARRETIAELEQQLKMLQGLIDRQAATLGRSK